MGEAKAEVGGVDGGVDGGINDELAKLTERKLKLRRRAVLVSTATLFTVAAILLFISLAQIQGYQVSIPHTAPRPLPPHNHHHPCSYQELDCEETDSACLALMCPQGWRYNNSRHLCYLPEGQ